MIHIVNLYELRSFIDEIKGYSRELQMGRTEILMWLKVKKQQCFIFYILSLHILPYYAQMEVFILIFNLCKIFTLLCFCSRQKSEDCTIVTFVCVKSLCLYSAFMFGCIYMYNVLFFPAFACIKIVQQQISIVIQHFSHRETLTFCFCFLFF